MPYNSTYANETDFLEWYRNRYGKEYTGENFVKPETMSDDDYEIGKSLYSSYLNSQKRASEYEGSKTDIERAYGSQVEQAGNDKNYATNVANQQADSSLSKLEQYYGTAVNALDKSKRQSQQNASIALDKLKKYLPTQIKAQGLGGLGVSESTMLKAYNNYNSDMGAIESDYQQNKTTLETNYADNKRGIESERDTAINAAEKSYNDSVARLGESKAQSLSELERAYNSANDNANIEAQANANNIFNNYKKIFEQTRSNNFNEAKEALYYNTNGNFDDLMNIVNAYKDKVSDDDFNNLTTIAKTIADRHKTDTEATSYQNYQNMANDIKSDSTLISSADIDKAVKNGALTDEDANELKQLITTTAKSEIGYYADSGNYDMALTEAKKAYGDGRLKEDDYQSVCYDVAIKNCAGANTISTIKDKESYLSKLKSEGALSSVDYNNAVNYLYASAGKVLNKNGYSTRVDTNIFASEASIQLVKVTIGGNTYNLSTNINENFQNADTTKILNKLAGGSPSNRTIVELGGKFYIYRDLGKQKGSGWITCNEYEWGINTTSKEFRSAWETAVSNQGVAKPAEHGTSGSGSTGGKKLTYEEVAKYNPGIPTASEFNRYDSMKQKYGTYQNYLAAVMEEYGK